jgi:acyl-CoA thioester hydrolase
MKSIDPHGSEVESITTPTQGGADPRIFTRTFRVRWGELDPSGCVGPANYLRYLIETAWDWGIAAGWDPNYSQAPDVLWLIRESEVHLLRPLRHNDIFNLSIWMVNWQKVRGTRCFELTFRDGGDVIAQGTQHIVYIDARTGRPAELPAEDIARFRLENPRVFPFERFPKIATAEAPYVSHRQVEFMDLDAYDHVNNAIYVSYAEEAAAQALSVQGWSPARLAEANLSLAQRRVHIQYLSLATWGERLTVSTHQLAGKQSGGSRYVGIAHAEGSLAAECILDWELVDRTSGETRPLPNELR